MAHPALSSHEDLQLVVFSDSEVLEREIELDAHAGEERNHHGEVVADLLDNGAATGGVLCDFLWQVFGERVGDVFVDVVKGEVFLVYIEQFDEIVAFKQFALLYHLPLLL